MSKLNIPQLGGYPIINEILQILADADMGAIRILDAINTPNSAITPSSPFSASIRDCIILNRQLSQSYRGNILVYIKDGYFAGGTKNTLSCIALVNTGSVTIGQLVANIGQYQVNINRQNITVTNSLGTFADAFVSETLTLTTANSVNDAHRFYFLDDALRLVMQSPTAKITASDCKFWIGSQISFDAQGNINGITPLPSNFINFVGTPQIEKVENFLKLNFSYSGTAAGPFNPNNNPVKNIIELPVSFVDFTKVSSVKSVLSPGGSDVNMAMATRFSSCVFKNYIFMPATTGAQLNVVDYIPIV